MPDIIAAKNYIILKPFVQKTKSGLDTIEPDKDMPVIGVVFRVGEGKQPFPKPLKEGDVILFKKYLSNKVFIPALSEYIDTIRFDDVCGLISEDKSE